MVPSIDCHAQSNLIAKEAMRQLAMEHAGCATFYLASSVCSQSNVALSAELKKGFEVMMERAYRFAREGGAEERTVTTYGKELLEEMNEEMRGNCRGMHLLREKYKTCKALAEDFTPRGREIMQQLVHPR
jgi:hypothetical protein